MIPPADSATAPANVALHLARLARRAPAMAAVIEPGGRAWRTTTYAELDARADAIAAGLASRGLASGDRTAVFVRPGADLVAIVYALFRSGAVPVLIDPGMGAASVVAALGRIRPRGFIGAPAAHALKAVHGSQLRSIEIAVAVGPRWLPGIATLHGVEREGARANPVVRASGGDETAAILFTSGSTGPAKGVVYTHAMFEAQVRSLKALYRFEPGEVDLACFPLFALFGAALEITSVFPEMDAVHPGRCDPELIVRAATEHGATTTFGSPAIWSRVVPWAVERDVKLPTLKRALIAGAPVRPDLVERFRTILAEGADVHTPYGATESLPVASIRGREILELRPRVESGAGTCVGRAAPEADVAVIGVTDEPIASWSESLRLAPRTLGEICVRGPMVTEEYADDASATRAAKIREAGTAGLVWHRMGDLGYADEDGRLWFCGRKSQRLETASGTIAPVPTENVLNTHPQVARSALVGVGARGAERPVAVIEPVADAAPKSPADRERFARELRELFAHRARLSPPRLPSAIETVLFHTGFPVDVRHEAKIRREELRTWAEEQLR